MNFCVIEIGRTAGCCEDILLIIINDTAYTVKRVPGTMRNQKPLEVLGTTPWAEVKVLFPWLEEQKTGNAYLRYPWIQSFLEDHVPDLFTIVPANLILGVPPNHPPGNDPQWTFYPAKTRVLRTEFDRGTIVKNRQSFTVRYERRLDRGGGELHQTGKYVWTNYNGTVRTKEVPDT